MMKLQNIHLTQEIQKFIASVHSHNLKLTPQRLEIAQWVFESQNHFSVDDLLDSFRAKGEKISTSTVYRLIQILLDLELVIEHDFGKGKKYYEPTCKQDHHDHIICNLCGHISEFTDTELEELKTSIALKKGFKMTSHALNIYADCVQKDCTHKTNVAIKK